MADNAVPTIVLTRPLAQARRFASEIEASITSDYRVVIVPLQEIVLLGPRVDLTHYTGLVFSSENAVAGFQSNSLQMNAWCVGSRTADAADKAGYRVMHVAPTADILVADLTSSKPLGTLLHVRGKHTRGAIRDRLKDAGVQIEEVIVYDQRAVTPAPSLLERAGAGPVLAPLFSPRSAKLFAATLPKPPVDWQLICLSSAIAAELPELWQNHVKIARIPSGREVLTLIAQHISP